MREWVEEHPGTIVGAVMAVAFVFFLARVAGPVFHGLEVAFY